MKDVGNNSDKEKQNGIDDDSIISELQQAYKDIESKRNTAEFKKNQTRGGAKSSAKRQGTEGKNTGLTIALMLVCSLAYIPMPLGRDVFYL